MAAAGGMIGAMPTMMSRPAAMRPITPPLFNGDRLTADEFERRWDATPGEFKAELIEGIVYMTPAVNHGSHGRPHLRLASVLTTYWAAAGRLVDAGDNSTLRMDLDNLPQPDLYLMIASPHGQATLDERENVVGAPELIAEISATSANVDLGVKLEVYRRNGVREYVVWRTFDFDIDYFVLRDGIYEHLKQGDDGVFRSEVFPGLWLDAPRLLAGDLAAVQRTAAVGTASAEFAAFVEKLKNV